MHFTPGFYTVNEFRMIPRVNSYYVPKIINLLVFIMKKAFVNCVIEILLLKVAPMSFVHLHALQTFATIIGITNV